MPHIQQREIPVERFGPLVEFDGQVDSTADIQAFLQKHGYIVFRQELDRDSVLAAREEVLNRLAEVGEISEPILDGRMTGHSQRPDPAEDHGEFWKSVSHGAALREVTHGPAAHALVAAVLGEAARAHDLMYLRPMAPGSATPLHYDYPFFAGDSERIYTVWIPFGDVPLTNGPLAIVEDSYRFDELLDPIRAIDFSQDRSNDKVQAAAYDAQNVVHPVDLAIQRACGCYRQILKPAMSSSSTASLCMGRWTTRRLTVASACRVTCVTSRLPTLIRTTATLEQNREARKELATPT